MAFPTIHHGIICEEIRNEQRNLISIMGFYGIMPDVEILVQDLESPSRLAFLLVGGAGSGNFNVSMRLIAPNDQHITAPPPFLYAVDAARPRSNLGFSLLGIIFRREGMHRFEVGVEGENEPKFRGQFSVRLARPGEFPQA